eukprot:g6291.t1
MLNVAKNRGRVVENAVLMITTARRDAGRAKGGVPSLSEVLAQEDEHHGPGKNRKDDAEDELAVEDGKPEKSDDLHEEGFATSRPLGAGQGKNSGFVAALRDLISQEVQQQVRLQQTSSDADKALEEALGQLVFAAVANSLGISGLGGAGMWSSGGGLGGGTGGGFSGSSSAFNPVLQSSTPSGGWAGGGGAGSAGSSTNGNATNVTPSHAGGNAPLVLPATAATSSDVHTRAHILHCGTGSNPPGSCYSLDSEGILELGPGARQVCPGHRPEFSNQKRYSVVAEENGPCSVKEGDAADAHAFRGWVIGGSGSSSSTTNEAAATSFLQLLTSDSAVDHEHEDNDNGSASGGVASTAASCSLTTQLLSRDLVFDTQNAKLLPPRGVVGLYHGVLADARDEPYSSSSSSSSSSLLEHRGGNTKRASSRERHGHGRAGALPRSRYAFELKPRKVVGVHSGNTKILYKIRLRCQNGATESCGRYLCKNYDDTIGPCGGNQISASDGGWFAIVPAPVVFKRPTYSSAWLSSSSSPEDEENAEGQDEEDEDANSETGDASESFDDDEDREGDEQNSGLDHVSPRAGYVGRIKISRSLFFKFHFKSSNMHCAHPLQRPILSRAAFTVASLYHKPKRA